MRRIIDVSLNNQNSAGTHLEDPVKNVMLGFSSEATPWPYWDVYDIVPTRCQLPVSSLGTPTAEHLEERLRLPKRYSGV